MTRPPCLVAVVAALALAVPASAQQTRLSPAVGEARLWTGTPVAPAPDPPVLSTPVRTPSSAWREAFLAGYLLGGLGGLTVAKRSTLPRPVGLWMQAWYAGVDITSDPSRLGSAPRPRWERSAHPGWGGSSIVDGLMEGFFDVLDITGTRVR